MFMNFLNFIHKCWWIIHGHWFQLPRIYSVSDFGNQFLSFTITNGSLFFLFWPVALYCSGIMVWVCLFEVCCIKILGIYVVILHSYHVPLFGAQSAVTERQYSTSCSTHQWCLCPPIYRERQHCTKVSSNENREQAGYQATHVQDRKHVGYLRGDKLLASISSTEYILFGRSVEYCQALQQGVTLLQRDL